MIVLVGHIRFRARGGIRPGRSPLLTRIVTINRRATASSPTPSRHCRHVNNKSRTPDQYPHGCWAVKSFERPAKIKGMTSQIRSFSLHRDSFVFKQLTVSGATRWSNNSIYFKSYYHNIIYGHYIIRYSRCQTIFHPQWCYNILGCDFHDKQWVLNPLFYLLSLIILDYTHRQHCIFHILIIYYIL